MSRIFQDYTIQTTVGSTADLLIETAGRAFEVVQAAADPYGCKIYRIKQVNGQNQAIDGSADFVPANVRGITVGDFDALILRQTGGSFGTWKIRVWRSGVVGVPHDPRIPGMARTELAYTVEDVVLGAGVYSNPVNLNSGGATVSFAGPNFKNSGLLALEKESGFENLQIREEFPFLDGAIYTTQPSALLIYHSPTWSGVNAPFNLYKQINSYDVDAAAGGVIGTNFASSLDAALYRERQCIDLSAGFGNTGPPTGGGTTNVKLDVEKGFLLPPGALRFFLCWDYSLALTFSASIGLRSQR